MTIFADDFGHTFVLRVLGRDKRPEDLTAVMFVELVWWRPNGAGGFSVIVTGGALLTDGSDSKVTGTTPLGLFDVAGNWHLFVFLRTPTYDIHAGPLEVPVEESPRTPPASV